MKRPYHRKLTLWYPRDTKPEADRVGVYEISASDSPKHRRGQPHFFSWWDGKQWSVATRNADTAKMVRSQKNNDQNRSWRGRTSP